MKQTESVETRIRKPGLHFHLCYTHNQVANSLSLHFLPLSNRDNICYSECEAFSVSERLCKLSTASKATFIDSQMS